MSKCRFCEEELNQEFINLGRSPLANSYLKAVDLDLIEPQYPLKVFVCQKCLLVQLEKFESPKKIFEDYAYFSSYSTIFLQHAKNFVEMIINRFNFDSKKFVIEIASNDGYLLQYFKEKKIKVLGIEPAKNIAKVAEKKGIPTLPKFFDCKLATELSKNSVKPDLVICNNVLAHVPELNDFISGLKKILKKDGFITIEFPHLLELISNNQFDTIYHEHFSYFSFFVVEKIFKVHGLVIFNVEKISTHGGSLRIFCKHEENKKIKTTDNVKNLLKLEEEKGMMKINYYKNFSDKTEKIKQDLIGFCKKTNLEGKNIVGYGAPAKAITLLNYCKISTKEIEYVVDISPHKQGLFLPGVHIEINSPEKIKETKPDYLIIFPWNLKEEIIEQNKFIRKWGGKFVILIPNLEIID